MTKWEYQCVCNSNINNLNRLGKEGWELVAITRIHSRLFEYFLKRKIGSE